MGSGADYDRVGLDLDLHAELHHPLRRQPEERRRAHGVARHEHEQPLPPGGHALRLADDERFAPRNRSRRLHPTVTRARARGERLGNIGILHEAVAHANVEHALPEFAHGDLLVGRHVRDGLVATINVTT